MTDKLPFTTDHPAICFDLEATGLDPTSARIIQIEGLKMNEDGRPIERVDKLINPERHIPFHVTQLTGITQADVQNAHTFAEIAGEVEMFFSGCHLFGADSKALKLPLLEVELARAGLSLPKDPSCVHIDIFGEGDIIENLPRHIRQGCERIGLIEG